MIPRPEEARGKDIMGYIFLYIHLGDCLLDLLFLTGLHNNFLALNQFPHLLANEFVNQL